MIVIKIMEELIPKDTRYVPLVQQKSCCVPASISIVMYKLGIPLISQELLGYYLGLTVSEESRYLFWNPRVGDKPPAGYGCRVTPAEKYKPNEAFRKLGVPLKMKIWSIENFKNKKEIINFVRKCIIGDKDLLVAFHHGVLKNEEGCGGHICVIDRIYVNKNIIRLIDPSPSQPKWREVKIDLLFEAIKKHPSGNGGFWELTRING